MPGSESTPVTRAIDTARKLYAQGIPFKEILKVVHLPRHVLVLACHADKINAATADEGKLEQHDAMLQQADRKHAERGTRPNPARMTRDEYLKRLREKRKAGK